MNRTGAGPGADQRRALVRGIREVMLGSLTSPSASEAQLQRNSKWAPTAARGPCFNATRLCALPPCPQVAVSVDTLCPVGVLCFLH